MHVNEENIHVLPATVGLPSVRQPLSRNVLTEENMQMRVPVFLEFKHADEGKRTLELPRQRNTEFSPTVSDIAISMLAVLPFPCRTLAVHRSDGPFLEIPHTPARVGCLSMRGASW